MHTHSPSHSSETLTGVIAGLAGTTAMLAMRSFDQRYAPKTMPKMRENPGEFILKQTEDATGMAGRIPRKSQGAGAMLLSIGYGTLAGVLYGKIRGHRQNASSLLDGGLIGAALYTIAYAGWLPLLRLTRPAWKQPLPKILGELLRHVAFGITTAAVYGAIHDRNE